MHNYQVATVNHILMNTHAGAFLDMGLGKTVSTLTAINFLIYEDLEIDKVLVIAPKRVAESVWSAEIEKWSHLKNLRLCKIVGSQKQRLAALKQDADVYMLGRDNVAWMCGQFGGSMLPFDMLVIDESSSFKNHKSLRFKALKKVQPCFERVVILTGTPAPNSLIDIWSQVFLLDNGERLSRFVTRFQKEYFDKSYDGWSYEIKKGAADRIHEKIGDICISMKASDYLDLPKTIQNPVWVEMPKSLSKTYDDFEKQQVLEMFESDTEITAVNAAALSSKLSQFANGALYDEDRNVHEVHSLKLDALEEIIESANGKPILLAYNFIHDCDRILKRFRSLKPVKLKTDQHIQDWNKGKIKLMVMHPASGGHGLNLQHGGHTIVWFGVNWSLELYQQFNARLDRQGQTHPVIINKILVKGTVDDDKVKALERKDKTQAGLMRAVKARIKKYEKFM